MATNNPQNNSVTGLYQNLVAAGAIVFPGTPVHRAITSGNATPASVLAALKASGLDLTGTDPTAFNGVIQTLIAQHNAIASLGTFFSPLADPDYQVPVHSTAQLANLFGSAKTLENAINLHINAASLTAANEPGSGNQ